MELFETLINPGNPGNPDNPDNPDNPGNPGNPDNNLLPRDSAEVDYSQRNSAGGK